MAVKRKDIDLSVFDNATKAAPKKTEIDLSAFDNVVKKKEPQTSSPELNAGSVATSPSASTSVSPSTVPTTTTEWTGIENSIQETRDTFDSYNGAQAPLVLAAPTDLSYRDASIRQAKQKYDVAKNRSDALLKANGKQLMDVVREPFKTDKWKQYYDESGNFKSGEAREHFDAEVKKRGGGQFLRDQLLYAFKNAGDYKLDEPDRTKFREEEYKKEGLDLGKYGKKLLELETKVPRQGIDLLKKETIEKGAQFLDNDIKPKAVEAGVEYTSKLKDLQERTQAGTIIPEAADAELQLITNDYKQKLASLDKAYKNGVRDINIKAQDKYGRFAKEFDNIVSSLTEDKLLKIMSPEDLAKKKKADETSEYRIAQKKNDNRKAQDKAMGLVTGKGEFVGILTKGIISGWNRGVSSLGDYISSKGIDNQFSRYLQSTDFAAQVFAPAQYEYGEDTGNRIASSVGTSLGASAPILLPTVGVTLASGGLGLPEIVTTLGAGMASYYGEKAMNTGEVYSDMLKRGATADMAYSKAKVFEDKQAVLMPFSFLAGASVINSIKGKAGKVLLGAGQELLEELPTEYYQGFTQAQAVDDYKKSFGEYIKENPETALDVIAGTIGQSGALSTAGKIFNSIHEKIPNAQSQYIADMVHKQGVPFALESLQKQFDTGVLDENDLSKSKDIVNRASQKIKDLNAAGIKGNDAQAYITLSDDINELTTAAEKSKDDGLKNLYEAKADEKRKELEAITKGEGVYAVIDMPGGANASNVVPISSLNRIRYEGGLDELIQNAEKVTVINDEALNTELNERKKQLGNPLDAPEGFYKNEESTEKSPALKLFEKASEAGGKGIKEMFAVAVNDDQKAEAVEFLKQQSIDTPNGLKQQLGGDTRLTTDIISQNTPESIQASIDKYEAESNEDGLSPKREEEITDHLDLLYRGLEKQQERQAKLDEAVKAAEKPAEGVSVTFPQRNDDFVSDRRFFSEQEEARYDELLDMGKQKEAQQLITDKKQQILGNGIKTEEVAEVKKEAIAKPEVVTTDAAVSESVKEVVEQKITLEKGNLKNVEGYDTFTVKKGKDRVGDFDIKKEDNGNVVTSAYIDKEYQRQGIGADTYRQLNEESIKQTGNPLRSSNTENRTADATALWESLVKSGEAEKIAGDNYRFKPPVNKEYNAFRERMLADIPVVKDSSFDFRISVPGLNQKEVDQGLRNIKEGKNTKAAARVEEYIKEMYDAGEVIMNRGRGNHAETMGIPMKDYFERVAQEEFTKEDLSGVENHVADWLREQSELTPDEEQILIDNLEDIIAYHDTITTTQGEDKSTPPSTETKSNERRSEAAPDKKEAKEKLTGKPNALSEKLGKSLSGSIRKLKSKESIDVSSEDVSNAQSAIEEHLTESEKETLNKELGESAASTLAKWLKDKSVSVSEAVYKIFNKILNNIGKAVAIAGLTIGSLTMSADANAAPLSDSTAKIVNTNPSIGGKEFIKKYGKELADRWTDYKILSIQRPDGRTYKDVFLQMEKEYGIPAEIIFASAAEEGFRQYVKGENSFNSDNPYPVNGFYDFGLDNFGGMFKEFVRVGLLPESFRQRFNPVTEVNENKEKVYSADFKTPEDAIRAKAAYLAYISDEVQEYADKKGIKLSDKALDFFMLVGYNAGEGNAYKMMTDYSKAGALKNDKFISERPTQGNSEVTLKEASWAEPYRNVMRRVNPANAWKSEGYFNTDKSISEKGKDIASKIRDLKSPSNIAQSNIFGIPVAIYDGAIETIATLVEGGAKIAEAIKSAINYIKDSGVKDFDESEFIKSVQGVNETDDIINSFIKDELQSGASPADIKTALIDNGLTEQEADAAIESNQPKEEPKPVRKPKQVTQGQSDLAISEVLSKNISEKEYPTIFENNKTGKQIAAITQGEGQEREVDGSYVEALEGDLRSISVQNARVLRDTIGEDWAQKTIDYLDKNPTAGNLAQVIGILNVISTDIFQQIKNTHDGDKLNKLYALQNKVDVISNARAREASLGLRQRILYSKFAQGEKMTDVLANQILAPEQQELQEAVKEILATPVSDAEVNSSPKIKTERTKKAPAEKKGKSLSKEDKKQIVLQAINAANPVDPVTGEKSKKSFNDYISSAMEKIKNIKC